MEEGRIWMFVGVVSVTGCLEYPHPLPAPVAETSSETSTSSDTSTSSGTIADSTTDATSTGPIAECGNGEVEDGEECDGTDWNGATCESVGFGLGQLACASCQFDVSRCGPPLGMVEVPGGVFEMGSTQQSNEQPIRQVHVDAFWIDETEVTVEAYAACVDAGACSEPGTSANCNWKVVGREDHPVNCLTWFQADSHCRWADDGTKRLPTEAEWEKAARGTDGREYPWGDTPTASCTHAVMSAGGTSYYGCGAGRTWLAGSRPLGVSPYGAHDMAGNVREWTADWYGGQYDPADLVDPAGPDTGTSRVQRGGAWTNTAPPLRTTARSSSGPGSSSNAVGFRCARTPPAPP
ncbi:formylglycine-generating enzyme family protein [Paraliomyxa miuraensis]|uniref:formylglycine-generating enzyme family protein n=1 Tax=Paraliomyxa miuraensis TaxID=376150 RepID=UPI00225A0173|nr:SUMF1/EgtB/PvdO family nonheme iron enzyme [Paraliomyxa miuraensis]MCX4240516.1 formylglycine-generating enzyme family protein [Paraliomyxa miuraensis]